MAATAILPELTKRIAYNRQNRDHDCFIAFDGEAEQYIGSASDYSAAEKVCNDYAYSYYEDNHTPEKAAQVVMTDEQATKDAEADQAEAAPSSSVRVEPWIFDDSDSAENGRMVGTVSIRAFRRLARAAPQSALPARSARPGPRPTRIPSVPVDAAPRAHAHQER